MHLGMYRPYAPVKRGRCHL